MGSTFLWAVPETCRGQTRGTEPPCVRVPRSRAGGPFPLTPLPQHQPTIVLLFPLDKRQQLAEAAAEPAAWRGRAGGDALSTPVPGSPEAARKRRGAGN